MNRKVSMDCVAGWWQDLSDLQKNAFADDPAKVAAFLEARAREIAGSTYVMFLSDKEAVELLLEKNYVSEHAQAIVMAWRGYSATVGYTGPVAWRVKQGFTLKTHALLAGPCYNNLDYLQDWSFEDTPTSDMLVFWVPRLAPGSISKTAEQMVEYRGQLRARYEMPANHCDRFGSISLLFALVLAHFKRTGERVPLNAFYAASDTLRADGRRLLAGGFDSDGLGCSNWSDSYDSGNVGVFLLGVEELGQ